MKPFIIAEVGCNHKGDFSIAEEMINVAAYFCKVDAVKFQKRNNRELLSPEEFNSPHPNPANSYGNSYGEHREYLEFTIEQHKSLFDVCGKNNVEYLCSVWDLTSAKEIASLKPAKIKIPSACNLNFKMIEWLLENFPGEIHISFGMTTHEEEKLILSKFSKYNRLNDAVVYSCTSGYPVAFEDICLYEITRLKESYGSDVKSIGFSGHHLGIAADIGALVLGAQIFERHFTLDRTWKGTDHAASLEPEGMRKLTRDLNNVNKALLYKSEEILPVEQVQRNKLKKSS